MPALGAQVDYHAPSPKRPSWDETERGDTTLSERSNVCRNQTAARRFGGTAGCRNQAALWRATIRTAGQPLALVQALQLHMPDNQPNLEPASGPIHLSSRQQDSEHRRL